MAVLKYFGPQYLQAAQSLGYHVPNWQDFLPQGQGGSEYGGGPMGTSGEREAQLMGSGTAPFSAGNVAKAMGNAFGIMGSSALTTGLGSVGEMAAGLPQGTLGGIQNIPGQAPYDRDIIDAVKSGIIKTRAEADKIQKARDEQKALHDFIGNSNYGDAGYGRRGVMSNSSRGFGGGGFSSGHAGDPYGTAGDRSSPSQAGRAGF